MSKPEPESILCVGCNKRVDFTKIDEHNKSGHTKGILEAALPTQTPTNQTTAETPRVQKLEKRWGWIIKLAELMNDHPRVMLYWSLICIGLGFLLGARL